MEGNIKTLACMKERSGRREMTFAASSLVFSSFSGLLSNTHKNSFFSDVDLSSPLAVNRHVVALNMLWHAKYMQCMHLTWLL